MGRFCNVSLLSDLTWICNRILNRQMVMRNRDLQEQQYPRHEAKYLNQIKATATNSVVLFII